MKRTFAAYQCLTSGSKTVRELGAAMNWTYDQTRVTVRSLLRSDQIIRRNRPGYHGYVYEAANVTGARA